MELGHCPRCATPYTASDVAGFGILRARAARRGGPRMEYRCQQCDRILHLVPHGEGRYAPPGEPPPPAVPASERRPPWLADEPEAPAGRAAPADEAPFGVPPQEPPGPQEPPPVDPEDPQPTDEAPLDAVAAMEILGIGPGADPSAIRRAFRERSLTCHPDKVAHLDAEFQALAERKFKRLQQAHDLLLS